MIKIFSKIEQFRHVVKTVQHYHEGIGLKGREPSLYFIGTVKLHGTNVGVRRKNGKLQAQSRETVIDTTCDHCGFAAFVEGIPETDLHALFDMVDPNPNDDVTIFGEFIGKGIHKNVAITQLDKQWVIFGAWINDHYVPNNRDWKLPEYNIRNIFEVGHYRIEIDFKDPAAALPLLEKYTKQVEEQCPWGELFGIKGFGEGIVWKCESRMDDTNLWFKTKGEKHSSKNKSGRDIANVDPQVVENINQCVDIILPEGRLEQGFDYLREQGMDVTMYNMGAYLQWVGGDVKKEEMDTIEANNLEWKDVGKIVAARAKDYFLKKYNTF